MVKLWSLKGKEKNWTDKGSGMKDGTHCDDVYSCYLLDDIETLRNELIEAIDIIDCTETSKLEKWEIIEKVLEIVDNKFGVE